MATKPLTSVSEARWALAGWICASLVAGTALAFAFTRGAPDFNVFYTAWRLVLEGRAMEVYHATPDRFLYAPGFAWVFAPLGLLPREIALLVWTIAKIALLGLVLAQMARLTRGKAGLAAWGIVIWARPLLIDFQYGQINFMMVAACVLALGALLERPSSIFAQMGWFVLGWVAPWKLVMLPLLAAPVFVLRKFPARLGWTLSAWAGLGVLGSIFLPTFWVGFSGEWTLIQHWFQAIADRGFPLETHNQSFLAFMYHWFSGQLTPVIALYKHIQYGGAWLSETQLHALGLAWAFAVLGVWLGILFSGPSRRVSPSTWLGLVTAFAVLPAHLVWKSYFVFGLPLASALCLQKPRPRYWVPALIGLFFLINFSGHDWVGHTAGAFFEASAVLLWALMGMFTLSLTLKPAGQK